MRATLCQLYADRNLFQILPYIEMEGSTQILKVFDTVFLILINQIVEVKVRIRASGTFGEVRWAIWRQNASGLSGDIDEEEDAACSDEAVIVKTLKPTASRVCFSRYFVKSSVEMHGRHRKNAE